MNTNNPFTRKQLELILEGLDEIENEGRPPSDLMSGLIAATSAEEAQAIMKEKIEKARTEARARKREVVMLKAQIIQMIADFEATEFFTPTVAGV